MIARALPVKLILYTLIAGAVISCATDGVDGNTLASLRTSTVEIKDVKIEGGLDKALESYQKFLEETPETAMTPEAIRRLADLKIEKGNKEADAEYDTKEGDSKSASSSFKAPKAPEPPSVPQTGSGGDIVGKNNDDAKKSGVIADVSESQKDFEKRVGKGEKLKGDGKKAAPLPPGESEDEIASANAEEAIKLYLGLLEKYPLYERNDQVLYQLSRAYEETGKIKKAIQTLDTLVASYPRSRHLDEAHFRRAEYFFSRKKYLDAEEAYGAIIDIGYSSVFYELALYKRGWSFFKQDLYEEALNDYIKMLDHKIERGYDFNQTENKIEKKRIEDTYRVISLSFSYLGGADAVVAFFNKNGKRIYEPDIYSHLGEYYFKKRRYSDAASAYNKFVELNPLHKNSPHFSIRVIEIYQKGGFPKLVVEAKKQFSTTYGLKAQYWAVFDIKEYPTVFEYLKTNLVDLAKHYHSLYQNKRLRKKKEENYKEAVHWYRSYIESFSAQPEAPDMNYQLAGLMLENKDYRDAATEYEKTAYSYPVHKVSSEAGYAAVYAYREFIKIAKPAERVVVKREVIRSSLKFAEKYPEHKNAALVLSAATDDLYELKDFENAIKAGRNLIVNFPKAEQKLIRSAWLVVAHASFDISSFKDAEDGYMQVLKLTDAKDASRVKLIENLAASIYKQGEQAREKKDHKTAAYHFLRIAQVTPTSKIRATADYDGAASLIALKDWTQSATVLLSFRKNYPKHKLQPEITKKLAIVYKEDKKYLLAAKEFERIETESKDEGVRREALLQAAELYEKAENKDKALVVYIRFVKAFPEPVEFALETRKKISDIYKEKNETGKYLAELEQIVQIDKRAGEQRTPRTKFLAANAALVLAEPSLERFTEVKLVKPFKKNLNKKKKFMKEAIDVYSGLVDYQVGDVTAAATYQLAEIYAHFSKALLNSERPTNLSELELEQYNLVIEEQAYPFEEKAIDVHEKNMELLAVGIYNEWIDKSIAKLAVLLPARYAKSEQPSEFIEHIVPPELRAKEPEEKLAGQPDTTVQEAQPETTVQESQPDTTVKESQPDTAVKESQPDTTVQEAQPETTVQEAQPETTVQEAQPETVVKESQPDTAVKESQPDTTVEESQPDTTANEGVL